MPLLIPPGTATVTLRAGYALTDGTLSLIPKAPITCASCAVASVCGSRWDRIRMPRSSPSATRNMTSSRSRSVAPRPRSTRATGSTSDNGTGIPRRRDKDVPGRGPPLPLGEDHRGMPTHADAVRGAVPWALDQEHRSGGFARPHVRSQEAGKERPYLPLHFRFCFHWLMATSMDMQVEEQTGGRMRLGPGTLYSSIQALLEDKSIEEVVHADIPLQVGRFVKQFSRRMHKSIDYTFCSGCSHRVE
jgi:hypothetical protein